MQQGYAVNTQQPGSMQPMQAIPVQYADSQQAYGGPVYAQQPVGGGQPIPPSYASAPPPYAGNSYNVSEPYQQPTKNYAGGAI
jgi:hypothetical protein